MSALLSLMPSLRKFSFRFVNLAASLPYFLFDVAMTLAEVPRY